MLKSGLVSVTFRQLTVEKIIKLTQKSGLDLIEWGGDIHVPHGDIAVAKKVKQQCNDSGINICSYGSYYRVAESAKEGLAFETVLDSAEALGAPIIRVWAGNKGSADADAGYRSRVIEDSKHICELAAERQIKVAYEYHKETLTDTNLSAAELLRQVDHPNLYTYWQPPNKMDDDYCAKGLQTILPRLTVIHAFQWRFSNGHGERRPLQEGKDRWLRFLELANQSDTELPVLIEFVRNDDPEQFLRDADALKSWLRTLNQGQ